jgi:RNA polymerase sigma-70 factor (ECF subfamily)
VTLLELSAAEVRLVSLRDAITPFVPGLRRYARALVNDASGDHRIADELVQRVIHCAVRDERLKSGGSIRNPLYAMLTSMNRSRSHRLDPAPTGSTGPSRAPPGARSRSSEAAPSPIERAVAMLSADLREPLLLVVLERVTYDDAAEILEVPLATLLGRLTRARDELRTYFNGNGSQRSYAGPPASRAPGHLRLVK